MIIITRSFEKELSHFSLNIKDELKSLISKYNKGLSKNFILLKKEKDLFIFKGYLDGKRIRITVTKTSKNNYIPLEILKKESKDGYNIRDDYDASNIIDRINKDISEDKYKIWELI